MTELKYINCPREWHLSNDWGSHRPLLYLILFHNQEKFPFIEFGSGLGSTFVLRKYCKEHDIKFKSYDTDDIWSSKTGAQLVLSFKDVNVPENCILFIDGKPGEERKDLIELHANKKVLIIHDTEMGADHVYQMSNSLSKFKYRLNYEPLGMPHTTAVSNFINVEEYK